MVTLLAAAAMGRGTVRLSNCPDIQETSALAFLLAAGGARMERRDDSMLVNGTGFGENASAVEMFGSTLARSIHGSVYLLPAILLRRGSTSLPYNGGCKIGSKPGGERPVEQYTEVFKRFGASTSGLGEEVSVSATELRGCEIDLLDFTSDRVLRTGHLYSGASKMALLCAAAAKGTSILHHLYPKPDVADLADMLSAMGADIEQMPNGSLVVHGRGGQDLTRDVEHELMPDLIEVVTWIVAAALLTNSRIEILGAGMQRSVHALAPEFEVFYKMGVRFDVNADRITAYPRTRLRATEVVVASCSVYSDAQPLLALLSCYADGRSTIYETVWKSRFRYATGLRALGARVSRRENVLRIDGPSPPYRPCRRIVAPDLRAASTLLLAALAVPGETFLYGAEHLDRGYASFVDHLRNLGACIEYQAG